MACAIDQIPPPTPGVGSPPELRRFVLPPSIVTPLTEAVPDETSSIRWPVAEPSMIVERAPAPTMFTSLEILSWPVLRS